MEQAPPIERMFRLRFEKMIENSLDIIKGMCLSFCGPFIVIEVIISLVYYKNIVYGCHKIKDTFLNVLIYILIIAGLFSLAVTGFCLF